MELPLLSVYSQKTKILGRAARRYTGLQYREGDSPNFLQVPMTCRMLATAACTGLEFRRAVTSKPVVEPDKILLAQLRAMFS